MGSHLGDKNPDGIQDLAGNVHEWTDMAADGAANLRPFRGGAWHVDVAAIVRATARYNSAAAFRINAIGFRCARSAK